MCIQYGINDLYLYRPGFYVPDISGSSRTVHTFVQVVTYRTLAIKADGQKITYCIHRHLSAKVADGFRSDYCLVESDVKQKDHDIVTTVVSQV